MKGRFGPVSTAHDFAPAKHAGQLRKGAAQDPCGTHLAEVAALVSRLGGNRETVAAAWLHDTVEDCAVPAAEIAERFGLFVAVIVAAVTDDKTLAKAEPKLRQFAMHRANRPVGRWSKFATKRPMFTRWPTVLR